MSLTSFFRERMNAANRLKKLADNALVSKAKPPDTGGSSGKLDVGFRVYATMKDGTFKTFYNLSADCPEGQTKDVLILCLENNAWNLLGGKYQVEALSVEVTRLNSH